MEDWLSLLAISVLIYLVGVVIASLLVWFMNTNEKYLGEEEKIEQLISWKWIICWPVTILIYAIIFAVAFLIILLISWVTGSAWVARSDGKKRKEKKRKEKKNLTI